MASPANLPYFWKHADFTVIDPGSAGIIRTQQKGFCTCNIRTAGAETRTVAAPEKADLFLMLVLDVDGGNATITVKNSAGSTTLTPVLDDAGDHILLRSVKYGSTLAWVRVSSSGLLSGDTLALGVDGLTEGGVIVPQYLTITVPILPHASLTEQNLFIAREAYQVVNIDVVPDLVQGGALTGTIVKASGTATPANGTTPMHTANAIDFNATAHTVQPITLTATTADLVLAAGDRIGLDLSAALTTGRAVVSIRMKRV